MANEVNSATSPWDTSDWAIKLKVFEGPLDLLIFLIRKNEIDIYDIPMEMVTNQYIEYLEQMERLDLEIAGDFFVMASTLMYIKSRMLLPPREQVIDEEPEETHDPRWELVQQLLEYRRYKELATEIETKIDRRSKYLDRIVNAENGQTIERPLEGVDRIDLWNIINQVYLRLSEKLNYGQIDDDAVTVAEQMEHILVKLETKKRFLFSDLFDKYANLVTIVTTFLALLELARLRKLKIQQDASFTDIECIAYS
jgi:segregation and condensation protein A